MASRLNRWACTQEVLDLVREHELVPASVSVTATYPGDERKAESVWVDTIEGSIEWPVMQATRRQFDDLFDITLAVSTLDKASEDAAMTRTEELVSGVVEALQDLSTLNDLDGVLSAEVSSVAFFAAETKTAGFRGIGQVVVSVHSRIT